MALSKKQLQQLRLKYAWVEREDGSWECTIGSVRLEVYYTTQGWSNDAFLRGKKISPDKKAKYFHTAHGAMLAIGTLARAVLLSLVGTIRYYTTKPTLLSYKKTV